MGAAFSRSPTRRRRSRKMWKPCASIVMSTRYWNTYCPITLTAKMPRHCSATTASRWSRFSSAQNTAPSIPAMKNAFRMLHTMPHVRLRRAAGEKLPARSSTRLMSANMLHRLLDIVVARRRNVSEGFPGATGGSLSPASPARVS